MTSPSVRTARLPIAAAAVATLVSLPMLLGGCAKPGRDLQPGTYRATVRVDGGELPFGLEVAKEQRGWVLYLINGEERVPVTGVQARPGLLSAEFPGSRNKLSATIAGGDLRGEVTLASTGGARRSLPFSARLGPTWRFFEDTLTDNVDVAGHWAITFTDDQGRTAPGIAELQQKFERVTGTLRMKDAEHPALAGEVHGEEMRLSRFDGTVGYLYRAKVNAKGQLEGECWSLMGAHQRFVATRNPDAALDTEPAITELQDDAVAAP